MTRSKTCRLSLAILSCWTSSSNSKEMCSFRYQRKDSWKFLLELICVRTSGTSWSKPAILRKILIPTFWKMEEFLPGLVCLISLCSFDGTMQLKLQYFNPLFCQTVFYCSDCCCLSLFVALYKTKQEDETLEENLCIFATLSNNLCLIAFFSRSTDNLRVCSYGSHLLTNL